MKATCEVCGKSFSRADTGRPRKYCSDRCKERAKRKNTREANRNAVARLADLRVGESNDGPAMCHVCARAVATRGTPERLICDGCAARVAV